MISRSYNTNRPEPIQQGSLTAMRGIDYTKAITVDNVVQDMRNLTVNTDGSLSIRKPLIAKKHYTISVNSKTISASKVIPLYDSSYTLIVYINGTQMFMAIEDTDGNAVPISFYGEYLDYSGTFTILSEVAITNVYNVTNLFDISNVQAINTSSSTVLGNVTVNLTNSRLSSHLYVPYMLDEEYTKNAPRYLSITKSTASNSFTCTVKTPEVNTLSTGSSLTLDPNLTLDNPYAIRDMYNSRYVSIDGILPYTYCTDAKTPSNLSKFNKNTESENLQSSDSYEPVYSNLRNMLAPHNPILVDFVGNTNAFVNYAYKTSDADADTKRLNFHSTGGVCFVYFNKFKFKNTSPHELSANRYDVCTYKPTEVKVKCDAVLVNPYFDNRYDIYVNANNPDDITGGYSFSKEFTFNDSAIQGSSALGYYVVCSEIPNAQALVNDLRAVYQTATDFSNVKSVEYTCEDNKNNYVNEQGQAARRPEYFGSLSYTADDSNTYTQYYHYNCVIKSTSTENGMSIDRYHYTGQGVVKLKLTVTVKYVFEGKALEYCSELQFNVFEHFKGTSSNWLITPWLNKNTLVGYNYPAYIQTACNIITNDFKTPVEASHYNELNPNLTGFNTTLAASYTYSESAEFPSHTVKEVVSNGTLSLPIEYRSGDLAQSIIFKTNLALQNTTPSAVVSGTVEFENPEYETLFKITHANNACEIVHTWNNTFETVNTALNITFSEGGYSFEELTNYSVRRITESSAFPKFQLTDVLKMTDKSTTLLKAFMHLKDNSTPYYGIWEYSTDGVSWKSYYVNETDAVLNSYFKELDLPNYTVSNTGDISVDTDNTSTSKVWGLLFNANAETDIAYVALNGSAEIVSNLNDAVYILPNHRPDVLLLQNLPEDSARVYCIDPDLPPIQSIQLRFTVCNLGTSDTVNILAVGFFNANTGLKWEFANTIVGNAVLGNKLYNKNTVYSYGHNSFNCNVIASDVGSFITPLSRIIDVASNAEDIVTALIAWRDYLVAFTEHDVHLISNADTGFYTKTVSTYIGVPSNDSSTCKSVLNGVIFKSGAKFYTLYPNYSSSDDSILNLNEISSPIDHILEALPVNSYDNFSISTNSEYYTFIPYDTYTLCVVYSYDNKSWQIYEYKNVRIVGYNVENVEDIYLYGYCIKDGVEVLTKYYFNKYISEAYPDLKSQIGFTNGDEIPYGDFLTVESLTPADYIVDYPSPTPIEFMIDTGQRTDSVATTKQFTETKLILATQSEKPAANFTVDVYTDGVPVKVRAKGDGIVFKTTPQQILTLGDAVTNNADSILNTVSHAYLKYSGKGKTIRHVITGESLYAFKIYEILYRYRISPNKI